jgi:hypothetical protein
MSTCSHCFAEPDVLLIPQEGQEIIGLNEGRFPNIVRKLAGHATEIGALLGEGTICAWQGGHFWRA